MTTVEKVIKAGQAELMQLNDKLYLSGPAGLVHTSVNELNAAGVMFLVKGGEMNSRMVAVFGALPLVKEEGVTLIAQEV